jgi:GNAT superfamily N-acetyltransferase
MQAAIRLATAADAPAFGRLLHAFNAEFGEPTPNAETIAERAAPLIEGGEVMVLLGGNGPEGFAQLRFRPSLYTGALDAYLEELYVVPERRGHGLGRALLEAAMRHAKERGCGAHRPRHERGRRRRAGAVRERRFHEPRGQSRRAEDALLRARPLSCRGCCLVTTS